MSMLWAVVSDVVIDCIRQLPFLFAAFVLIEALEHYQKDLTENILTKFDKAGPVVGALLGCVPQCGFSVLTANLFSGGVVTLGTLIAVFIATSDEAILIIMGNPGQGKEVLILLSVKVVIGVAAGYVVDLVLSRWIPVVKMSGELCEDCGCNDHGHHHHKHTIWEHVIRPACMHTIKIFGYILAFSIVIGLLIEGIGLDRLSAIMLGNTIFQPMIAALIGLIPNCAASVALTQLYLDGVISFASVIAGLCTGAGIGLVVLLRVNKNKKENAMIVGILYVVAVIAGMLLQLF